MKKFVCLILVVFLLSATTSAFANQITYPEFYDFWDMDKEPLSLDLNLDGSPDTIQTEVYGFYYGHFNLIINEQRFTIGVFRHGSFSDFFVTDINPADNFLDIVIFDDYKGRINASIYRYDGKNLFASTGYDVITATLTENDDDMEARYQRIQVTVKDGGITFACEPERHEYPELYPFEAVDTFPVYLNGEKILFDQPPIKTIAEAEDAYGDRILVPLRAITEALGATVTWDDATQTANLKKEDTTVSVTIGSYEILINGEAKTLDTKPVLLNDRTLVPVRAISESFGCTVDWNEESGAVLITQ